jgi:hypothetical protein
MIWDRWKPNQQPKITMTDTEVLDWIEKYAEHVFFIGSNRTIHLKFNLVDEKPERTVTGEFRAASIREAVIEVVNRITLR